MKAAAILALLFAATTPPSKTAIKETNDRLLQQALKSIAGHENEPAEQVFMDIRIEGMKQVTAKQFLTIMNVGFAKGLGVACTHCHVEKDFSSDEKRPKRAAREMAAMHRMINQQLAAMKELESPKDERSINCSTCHRGSIDPVGSEQQ